MIPLYDLSRATDHPPIAVPDFVPSPLEPAGLRPYQFAGIAYGLRARHLFIADQMGVGKTLEALGIVSIERAFPFVVVCPATFGRQSWADKISTFFPSWSYQIIDSMDSEILDRQATILSYSLLGARTKKEKCNCPHAPEFHNKKTGVCSYRGPEGACHCAAASPRSSIFLERLVKMNPAAVIFDEGHRLKTGKAARTDAAKRLASGARLRLILTGTPSPNRPKELIPQLDVLGMISDKWRFLQEYCNPWGWGKKAGCKFCCELGPDGILRSTGRGGRAINPKTGFCRVCKGTGDGLGFWDFNGARNLDGLNRKLRSSCFVRRLKSEVQADMPPKTVSYVPLEIDNRATYNAAEAGIVKWLQENRGEGAAVRASKAEEMVRIEILKQLAVEGKMAGIIDWIENFLESGEKLVVFSVHRKTAETLGERFGCPIVIGGGSPKAALAAVARFQADPEMKLIVLNIEVGGEVIELYAAHDVAFVELSWVPKDHEQAEDRVHRRGVRDAVTAWYLVAQGTVEQRIYDNVLPVKAAVSAGVSDGAGDLRDAVIRQMRGLAA